MKDLSGVDLLFCFAFVDSGISILASLKLFAMVATEKRLSIILVGIYFILCYTIVHFIMFLLLPVLNIIVSSPRGSHLMSLNN